MEEREKCYSFVLPGHHTGKLYVHIITMCCSVHYYFKGKKYGMNLERVLFPKLVKQE
jgi:hypothetical protein